MKKLLLLALWLLWSWYARAQQPIPAVDSLLKVNVERAGRYSHTFYTLNGEPITSGTLKQLLAKYPESAAELHKWRVQKRNGLLLLPVFLAAAIVGGTQADQQQNAPGSNFSKAPVPFSISLAALFGSLVVSATNDHLGKAIEAYNRHFHARQAAR